MGHCAAEVSARTDQAPLASACTHKASGSGLLGATLGGSGTQAANMTSAGTVPVSAVRTVRSKAMPGDLRFRLSAGTELRSRPKQ
jgi:hypothetical protein